MGGFLAKWFVPWLSEPQAIQGEPYTLQCQLNQTAKEMGVCQKCHASRLNIELLGQHGERS